MGSSSFTNSDSKMSPTNSIILSTLLLSLSVPQFEKRTENKSSSLNNIFEFNNDSTVHSYERVYFVGITFNESDLRINQSFEYDLEKLMRIKTSDWF